MASRSRNPQIYVKGYGKNITKQQLKNWFRQFGKILCIQYKGPYSFIQFEDYYDAQAAVKQMNDKKMQGYRLVVEPSGKKKNRSRSRSNSRRKNKYVNKSDSSSYSSYSRSSSRSSSSSSSRSSESSSSISNSYSNNTEKLKATENKKALNDFQKFEQDTFLRVHFSKIHANKIDFKQNIIISFCLYLYLSSFSFFLEVFFFLLIFQISPQFIYQRESQTLLKAQDYTISQYSQIQLLINYKVHYPPYLTIQELNFFLGLIIFFLQQEFILTIRIDYFLYTINQELHLLKGPQKVDKFLHFLTYFQQETNNKFYYHGKKEFIVDKEHLSNQFNNCLVLNVLIHYFVLVLLQYILNLKIQIYYSLDQVLLQGLKILGLSITQDTNSLLD